MTIGVLILFVLVLGIGVWSMRDLWTTKGYALRQETPDWKNQGARQPGSPEIEILRDSNYHELKKDSLPGILMRYAGPDGGLLLLKHTVGQGVYSFDSVERRTDVSTAIAWQEAKGPIVICEEQRWTRQLAFNMDVRYRLISYGEGQKPYDTHGKYALDAVVSTSKRKAAVLSAAGPRRPFLSFGFPGLGGADVKIHGQRYVQVMDLTTKDYVDKAVKLYADVDVPCFSSCWSSDEKILISYNCNFSDFQVVEP